MAAPFDGALSQVHPETPSQPLIVLCDDEEVENTRHTTQNVPSPFDTSKSGLEMFVMDLDRSFSSDEPQSDVPFATEGRPYAASTIFDDGLTPLPSSSSCCKSKGGLDSTVIVDESSMSNDAQIIPDIDQHTISTESTVVQANDKFCAEQESDEPVTTRKRRRRHRDLDTSETSSGVESSDSSASYPDNSNSEPFEDSGPEPPKRPKRIRAMTNEEAVLQGLTYNHNADLEIAPAGRKGRGVFAKTFIAKGTYLCEYRTSHVYHPKKKPKYLREYDANGEGSYLLETQHGRRLVFDATRCGDQFGRYINHAPKKTNCTYWRPLLVRGKWRVGFISTRDIEEGDELLFDYGVRGEAWMSAASPKMSIAKKQTYSFETYRKRRYCPVEGCVARRPLKKLSNHLHQQHPGLSKEEVAKHLRNAKYDKKRRTQVQNPAPSQRSLTAFFDERVGGRVEDDEEVGGKDDSDDGDVSVVTLPRSRKGKSVPGRKNKKKACERSLSRSPNPPQSPGKLNEKSKSRAGNPKTGSTRDYPRFPITEGFLMRLLTHCYDRFGLAMNTEAGTELVVDVSKYLKFSSDKGGCSSLNPHDLYNTDHVRAYLTQLEGDGVQCSGQLTKLSRIMTALAFAEQEGRWKHGEKWADVDEAKDTMTRWKACLQKQRSIKQKAALPDLSKEIEGMGEYTKIMNSPELASVVSKAMDDSSDASFNTLRAYIAMYLFLTCSSRKSAIENLSVEEYEQVTELKSGKERYWVVLVNKHKTASCGPAKLVLTEKIKHIIDNYLCRRRGRGTCPNLLVDSAGRASSRLFDIVRKFARKFGVDLPTPTLHRKLVGTKAATLPQGEQELVASFMAHSLDTQRRYYRALESKQQSVEAFKTMNEQLLPIPNFPKIVEVPKRQRFSSEQEQEIRSYFSAPISEGKCPSLQQCKQFLVSVPIPNRSAKNIQDKVRNMLKAK